MQIAAQRPSGSEPWPESKKCSRKLEAKLLGRRQLACPNESDTNIGYGSIVCIEHRAVWLWAGLPPQGGLRVAPGIDRKSTRLNSSHVPYTTLFRSPRSGQAGASPGRSQKNVRGNSKRSCSGGGSSPVQTRVTPISDMALSSV